MWDPVLNEGTMPGFWPPKPTRLWAAVLAPLRRYYLHRFFGIAGITLEGWHEAAANFAPGDGVLIAPNHSHDSDPHVMMEAGARAGCQFHFMAAWQMFSGHGGIDGFILQRMGAFSVDREGCDRRAIKQAVELLTTGRKVVVFPEGEVFHLNDRLTPLLEGVAFMALNAQKELERAGSPRRVWVLPTAIRYRYVADITPQLETAVGELERRLVMKPQGTTPLEQRITRVGEVLLTIKEKEILGRSRDQQGTLPERLDFLLSWLLEKLETTHLGKSPAADTIPLRVKALRRHLFEVWLDEGAERTARRAARESLEEVQLVLRLYSYPGNYIASHPSIEHMAETVEQFEEDLNGVASPKGRRDAHVVFGAPIDLRVLTGTGRTRAITSQATNQLEAAIQKLMARRP